MVLEFAANVADRWQERVVDRPPFGLFLMTISLRVEHTILLAQPPMWSAHHSSMLEIAVSL